MVEEKQSERELQDARDELERRANQKLKDLAEAEAAVRELTSRIVDAADKDRPGLIAERVQLVGVRDLLLAEHNELQSRQDAAYLAIYEYRADQAREESRVKGAAAIQARHAQDAADATLRVWQNGGRSKLPQAEGDARDKELRQKVAGIQADAQIASREAGRAGMRRDAAIQELEEVRRELGLEKAGRS